MKYQLSQLKEKQAKIAARALEEMELKLVQVAIEVTHEKRALKKVDVIRAHERKVPW